YGSRTPGLVVMDDAIARHGSRTPRWLEMLLWLGSSERRRCWLATTGASATAVAATGDRLAAREHRGLQLERRRWLWVEK
ncbi:hypothetical protein GW17_00050847, partial [Ensete ventricosum]